MPNAGDTAAGRPRRPRVDAVAQSCLPAFGRYVVRLSLSRVALCPGARGNLSLVIIGVLTAERLLSCSLGCERA